MIVGLVLIAGSAVGFWYVVESVDERQTYVVASRTIEQWAIVSADDFTTVEAHLGEAAAMTVPELGAVLGTWSTGRIPAGSFVTGGMFALPPLSGPEEADRVLIQVALPASEVAFGTLEAGDTVALIGREADQGALGLEGGAEQTERTLIGVLTLEFVQGGSIYYTVDPVRALDILSKIERFESASDRLMWKMGFDLTEADIVRALSGVSGTLTPETIDDTISGADES